MFDRTGDYCLGLLIMAILIINIIIVIIIIVIIVIIIMILARSAHHGDPCRGRSADAGTHSLDTEESREKTLGMKYCFYRNVKE